MRLSCEMIFCCIHTNNAGSPMFIFSAGWSDVKRLLFRIDAGNEEVCRFRCQVMSVILHSWHTSCESWHTITTWQQGLRHIIDWRLVTSFSFDFWLFYAFMFNVLLVRFISGLVGPFHVILARGSETLAVNFRALNGIKRRNDVTSPVSIQMTGCEAVRYAILPQAVWIQPYPTDDQRWYRTDGGHVTGRSH